MKTLITAMLLLMLIPCWAIAAGTDPKNKGMIKGSVFDKESQKPVEFATIVLHEERDSALLIGTISSAGGNFSFENLPCGTYNLEVNFLGYRKERVSGLILSPDTHLLTLEKILMEPLSRELEEVAIVADRNNMEYHAGKKVVNVDQNMNAKGGTAADALKNVPGITVDNEDNILVRGNASFKVLIDGKPSPLPGNEALKQVQAGLIDKIEVITNPSAKYQAEGVTGIINVIMKKNLGQGISGLANASAGTGNKYSGDANLNINKNDKTKFYINTSYNRTTAFKTNEIYREFYLSDTTRYVNTLFEQKQQITTPSLNGGFDYSVNSKNTLSASGRYTDFGYKGDFSNRNHLWFNPELVNIYDRSTKLLVINSSIYSFDLSHRKIFDGMARTLNTSAFITGVDGKRNFECSDYLTGSDWNTNGIQPGRNRFGKIDRLRNMVVSSDLEWEFDSGLTLECGIHGDLSPVTNKQNFEIYQATTDTWISDGGSDEEMKLNNNIYAAYSSLSYKFKGMETKAGLRSEYNDRLIALTMSDKKYSFSKLDFFPSASVSKEFPNNNQVQVSYSRRITRPAENQLNPLPVITDKYVKIHGNPGLLPEYTDSYELNYSKRYNRVSVSIDNYFRQSKNSSIQRIRTNEKGDFIITFENIEKTNFLGADISGNTEIFSWLSVNQSMSLFGYKYFSKEITYVLPKTTVSCNLKTDINLTIYKKTKVMLSSFFNAPFYDVQGYQRSFIMLNASVKRELFKGFTATLRVANPFNVFNYRSENREPHLYNTFNIRNEANVFTLNISYNFKNYKPTHKPTRGAASGIGAGI